MGGKVVKRYRVFEKNLQTANGGSPVTQHG
jgi:hypothetical protein